MLSPHDPNSIWLGGNRLFRSSNRGDTWMASEDLTKQIDRNTLPLMGIAGDRTMLSKNDGVTSYGTIIAVSESPVSRGVVWAGTDDGNVQVSRDGGVTFTEVGKNIQGLPANHVYWISRIDASHFDGGTAYISVDGHRDNDLKPYVYVTRDYGKTWQSISQRPAPVRIRAGHPRRPEEQRPALRRNGVRPLHLDERRQELAEVHEQSADRARRRHPRPSTRQRSDLATHARGVWILDDITALQQMTPAVTAADATLFDVRPAVAWLNDQQAGEYTGGQKYFAGENPQRGASINYYLKGAASGDVKVTIADVNGRTLRTIDAPKTAGLNRVMWNLTAAPAEGQGTGAGRGQGGGGGGGGGGGRGGGGGQQVEPGTYVVTLDVGGKKLTKSVTVLQDIWMSQR